MSERNVSPGPFRFEFNALTVSLILSGVFLIALAATSIYTVEQKEEAVVLTFGQYSRTEGPGMKFKLPFGIEANYNVPTKEVQTMSFGFRPEQPGVVSTYSQLDYSKESNMLTGDLNIVDLTWVIQYRIVDPKAWLFNLDNELTPRVDTVRDISQSVINQLVGDRAILEVMGKERTSIEVQGQELMNQYFDYYAIGVFVTQVNLKDIIPPKGSVNNAFLDVTIATQDRDRQINEGREAYNKEIPRVAGEAKQMIQQAEGYAIERTNEAKGDVERFLAVLAEYRRNPQVMRTRLYYETMEQIFSASKNTELIDKKLSNFIPLKTFGGGVNP